MKKLDAIWDGWINERSSLRKITPPRWNGGKRESVLLIVESCILLVVPKYCILRITPVLPRSVLYTIIFPPKFSLFRILSLEIASELQHINTTYFVGGLSNVLRSTVEILLLSRSGRSVISVIITDERWGYSSSSGIWTTFKYDLGGLHKTKAVEVFSLKYKLLYEPIFSKTKKVCEWSYNTSFMFARKGILRWNKS